MDRNTDMKGIDLGKQSDISFNCIVEADIKLRKDGIRELTKLKLVRMGIIEVGKEGLVDIDGDLVKVEVISDKQLKILEHNVKYQQSV